MCTQQNRMLNLHGVYKHMYFTPIVKDNRPPIPLNHFYRSKFLEIYNRSGNNHSRNALKPPNFNMANHAWKGFLLLYHFKANLVITVKYSEPRGNGFSNTWNDFQDIWTLSELYNLKTFRVQPKSFQQTKQTVRISYWDSQQSFLLTQPAKIYCGWKSFQ